MHNNPAAHNTHVQGSYITCISTSTCVCLFLGQCITISLPLLDTSKPNRKKVPPAFFSEIHKCKGDKALLTLTCDHLEHQLKQKKQSTTNKQELPWPLETLVSDTQTSSSADAPAECQTQDTSFDLEYSFTAAENEQQPTN